MEGDREILDIAYVLINIEPGFEKKVLSEIKNLSDVKESHITFGTYDIIAKIEVKDSMKMKEYIFNRIRKIENVRSTITLIKT